MDITQLILDDHHEQRRLFAMLEQLDSADGHKLQVLWTRLATALEVHAAAEEKLFYPELLRIGKGADGKKGAKDETKDAIEDHNDIRDAIAAVGKHKAGSAKWIEAVAKANKANGDHMAEEERQGLTDFRRNASLKLRHDLATAFAAFEVEHVDGVAAVDQDPKKYIKAHAPR